MKKGETRMTKTPGTLKGWPSAPLCVSSKTT